MIKIIADINKSVASGFVSSGYIIREVRSEGEYRKIREETGKGKLIGRMKAAVRSRHKGGGDIKTVQELLGYKDIKTTMIYTHLLNRGPSGVKSPADEL